MSKTAMHEFCCDHSNPKYGEKAINELITVN